MAARRGTQHLSAICSHPNSRQLADRPPGLTAAETWVLRAACDEAVRLGTLRLTRRQVAARLDWMAQPDEVVERSLDSVVASGYLVADDQPDLPDIILHVTRAGFEAYATRFINEYLEISSRVLSWLAERGAGWNARDIAHACGIGEFLAMHIVEMAAASSLIQLRRSTHYLVVSSVNPALRQSLGGVGAQQPV